MRSEIGGSASARIRGPGAAALLTTTIAALCLLGLAPRPASGRSVAIVGNHFVDGQRVIRLIGVDRSGSEHACTGPLTGGGFGYGIFAGPRDRGDAELEGERRNARAQRCFFRLAKRVSGTTVSLGTMTSSPRPRPAGCRSVGNAVTRVARSRRLHLVRCGSLRAPSVPRRDFRCGTIPAASGPRLPDVRRASAPVPKQSWSARLDRRLVASASL